jgi:hypothetical protein
MAGTGAVMGESEVLRIKEAQPGSKPGCVVSVVKFRSSRASIYFAKRMKRENRPHVLLRCLLANVRYSSISGNN